MIFTIRSFFASRGYEFFDRGDYNLNIVGVRTLINENSNKFNDRLLLIFKRKGLWQLASYHVTTDAGVYYRQNPLNTKGCLILPEGQNKSAWKLGWHKGKYEALVQARPIEVYRDANMDTKLDFDPKSMDEGLFGVNFHHAGAGGDLATIDRHSAGCQVFRDVGDFDEFMTLCRRSAQLHGETFTYTLITSGDLPEIC